MLLPLVCSILQGPGSQWSAQIADTLALELKPLLPSIYKLQELNELAIPKEPLSHARSVRTQVVVRKISKVMKKSTWIAFLARESTGSGTSSEGIVPSSTMRNDFSLHLIGLFFSRRLPKDQNCRSRSIRPIHIFTRIYQTLKSGLSERNTDSLMSVHWKLNLCTESWRATDCRIVQNRLTLTRHDQFKFTHQKTVLKGWLLIKTTKSFLNHVLG